MMRGRYFGAALALATLAAPAHADWKYTHWGDTPEAVVAASGGTAKRVDGTRDQRVFEQDWRAVATEDFDGVPLDAEFYFSPRGHRLSVVRLKPRDTALCDALGQAAIARYGAPDEEYTKAPPNVSWLQRTWHDDRDRMSILFLNTSVGNGAYRICHVIYRPRNEGA